MHNLTAAELSAEAWRDVPGWSGYYEVSDLGRVRSLSRTISCANGNRQRVRGQILSGKTSLEGRYPQVLLCRSGYRKVEYVHRLVLSAFVGPPPEGWVGCHGDGNPLNNRISNLRWGTESENLFDTVRHGRHHGAVKTHCNRQHLLVAPNLTNKRGRNCKACQRARSKSHAWKKVHGRPLDEQVFQMESDRFYARIMASAERDGLRLSA